MALWEKGIPIRVKLKILGINIIIKSDFKCVLNISVKM